MTVPVAAGTGRKAGQCGQTRRRGVILLDIRIAIRSWGAKMKKQGNLGVKSHASVAEKRRKEEKYVL
jgi:hypothetical protein